ncbi:MAG: molecular chaperone DnaJ [Bacteroidota bacterium]
MRMEIVREMAPEEKELEKKRLELATLEAELAQRELELVTFQAELNAFRNRYLQALGKLYAELDAILADLANLQALRKPACHQAWKKAEQARAKAEESARSAKETRGQSKSFKPSEKLKKLYREIAKNFHPDLAGDEEERTKYQQLMAEANQAYKSGDEQLLEKIYTQGKHSPESVKGVGAGVDLVRVIRKIASIGKRLEQIASEMDLLKRSSLYQLRLKYEEMKEKGIDLLAEMAGYLNRQITEACIRLNRAKKNK